MFAFLFNAFIMMCKLKTRLKIKITKITYRKRNGQSVHTFDCCV